MSQDHDQPRTELFSRELDAADQRRGYDITGHAYDEQISETLIENYFDGHTRVGTTKNGGERLLARCQLEAAHVTGIGGIAAAAVRYEAPVSLLQERERFVCHDHR
jgi:hypothetical protein